MFKGKFEDIVLPHEGFLRGPFGSALKKSLFVPKAEDTYKVYEQSVVLQEDKTLGEYYISKKYFEENLSRFEVKSGDFLVSCSGVNYGAIYQLKGEIDKGVINQALLRIRINPQIVDENYFLYYFKAYIVKKITGGTGDSTIPNFPPMSVVKEIDIQLPDIDIQRKIGKILAEIDNKINNNNAINAELESMVGTIYDYWFLQFDFPDKNGKPYKSSGGKMVWNEKLKREIPEGWIVENLANNSISCIIKPGVDYFTKKNYLATANVIKEAITDGEWITYEKRENRANMQPQKNSVWFAKMKNSIKHVSLPFNSDWFIDKYILSTGFLGLSCSEESFAYIHSVINNNSFETIKDILAHGATQEAINNNDLEEIKIVIPDNGTLNKYKYYVESLLEQKMVVLKTNQELAALREFLLPLLMNGQVGFKDKDGEE